MKTITFRYFDVSDQALTSNNSLVQRLINKLTSSASSRMMPLNKQESDKSDLTSDFLHTTEEKRIVAGTYLRIANSSDVPIITEAMLSQNQFKVSTINKNASEHEKTCLDYFYFCMSDDKLIVTVDSRSSINRMETYVNGLLNTKESESRITFTPIVDETAISAADLKKNTFNTNSSVFIGADNSSQKHEGSSVFSITRQVLEKIFTETDTLDNLFKENICSAQLVVKFSKPKNMDIEEYKRKTIGAALKPIEDTRSISIQTNGKKMKGSQVLKTETINIEDVEGSVSEQEVYQKMIQRLR